MAEAALITPVFAMLLFGILEFGGAFRDYLTMSNAVASGARQEAIQGNNAAADYETMKAITKAAGAMPLSQINFVVVWKATGTTDSVPSGCKTGPVGTPGASTVANGSCNRFTGDQVRNPSNSWTCSSAGSDPIRYYCPTLRSITLNPTPPDYVGVYIQITHPWVTGLFGKSVTMSDQAITRLEPQKLS